MERTALVTGTPEQIQRATQIITELVNTAVMGGAGGGGQRSSVSFYQFCLSVICLYGSVLYFLKLSVSFVFETVKFTEF